MQSTNQNLTTQSAMDVLENSIAANISEYLAFNLGKEEYAIDILKVQEIRGYGNVTRIANTPEFIKGVINLRGTIIPVVDMRIKFQLSDVSYDQFTVLIILNLTKRVVGMVVDSVSDVVSLAREQIRPAPEFSGTFDSNYLTGLASLNDRMLILVDIDKLMSSGDMGLSSTLSM